MDVLEQCVEGSETGAELEAAFETCFVNEGTATDISTRLLARPMYIQSRQDNDTEECWNTEEYNGNNTAQCLDYNDTIDELYKAYAEDFCVLNELGWFLTNGTMGWNAAEFFDDIAGLPNATAEVNSLFYVI